jgi:hypothetical protein
MSWFSMVRSGDGALGAGEESKAMSEAAERAAGILRLQSPAQTVDEHVRVDAEPHGTQEPMELGAKIADDGLVQGWREFD